MGNSEPASAQDYYLLDETLSEQELAIRDRVRAFADREVLPIINDYWERAQFPFQLRLARADQAACAHAGREGKQAGKLASDIDCAGQTTERVGKLLAR